MKLVLPIDVVPNTRPPRFRWRCRLTDGRVQECTGMVAPSMEGALCAMIKRAKELEIDNKELWDRVEALGRAEQPKPAPVPQPLPVGKGQK